MDGVKNFAKSTLASGIAAGATSLSVASGGGAKFPAVPFNAVIWNSTDNADPADDSTKEIVRVTAISTDTFTIARGQEGTSDVNHNTGGKTYSIIAGPTAKLVTDQRSAYRHPFPNAKAINSFSGNMGSSGDVDFYTVPTGRRAILTALSANNNTGGSINVIPKLKVSSTYYRLGATTAVSAGTNSNVTGLLGVAEAGESFAVNVSATGLNVWLKIVEFDSSSPIVCTRLLGTAIANGDNTLYTCPSGYSVVLLSCFDVPASVSTATGGIRYGNDTGSSRTLKLNVVPSGGSVGTSNLMVQTQTASNAALTAMTPTFALAAGDFVSVNVDSNSASQILWIVVQEIPLP